MLTDSRRPLLGCIADDFTGGTDNNAGGDNTSTTYGGVLGVVSGSGSLTKADPVEESAALEAAQHAGEHEQLQILLDYQNRIHGNGKSDDSTGELH